MSQIILKNVGRGDYNKTIEVEGKHTEEELAERAWRECRKHILSSDSWLEPDEEKGDGFWKLYVGYGRHVGDVEIKV